MYEVFRAFENIDEVIILDKKDKRGKRYDFVKFFNVKDQDYLTTKLDNIFMGTYKIL